MNDIVEKSENENCQALDLNFKDKRKNLLSRQELILENNINQEKKKTSNMFLQLKNPTAINFKLTELLFFIIVLCHMLFHFMPNMALVILIKFIV